MSDTLQFKAGFVPGPVGNDGLVKGVSVISEGPAVGHDVHVDGKALETVLAAANRSPGGVKCKMEHAHGVDRIIGCLSNFRRDGKQVRADLQLLTSHPAYTFLRELIAKQPATFGLSISFRFTTEEVEKVKYLRVSELFSADVVDTPAANPAGLFSGESEGTFEGACRALHKGGMTKSEAVFRAVAEFPILYGQYRQRGGEIFEKPTAPAAADASFGSLVAAQVKTGKTMSDALSFCVRTYPDAYQAWRAGDTSKL